MERRRCGSRRSVDQTSHSGRSYFDREQQVDYHLEVMEWSVDQLPCGEQGGRNLGEQSEDHGGEDHEDVSRCGEGGEKEDAGKKEDNQSRRGSV